MSKENSKSDQLRAMREARAQSSRGGVGSKTRREPSASRQSPMADAKRSAQATPIALPGVVPGPRETKRGRPLDADRASSLAVTQPWKALRMSERTWYRRKAEGKL